MKKIILSALALMGVGAMMPAEVSAQFRVVKDGKAILVMEDEVPDYVDFEVGAQEDGHLTLEQLMAMTTVAVDKSADGKNGNVLNCSTSAPVNAKWTVDGVPYLYNCFTKNMDAGEHIVILDALCADGARLTKQYTVTCDVITTPKSTRKVYLYGGPDRPDQKPFSPRLWSGDVRVSDNEGIYLPYLSDDVYWGHKTLVFEFSEAHPSYNVENGEEELQHATLRVSNGWWYPTYAEGVEVRPGLWELTITEEMAKDCARGNGGDGHDLQLILMGGSITIRSVYYEEDVDEAKAYVLNSQSNTSVIGKPVDMGLSVKWSSINLGASRPEESGWYIAWGETETKSDYSWETYKHMTDGIKDSHGINKYTVDDGSKGHMLYDSKTGEFLGDGKTTLEKIDDAAAANWGGDWRMPTAEA